MKTLILSSLIFLSLTARAQTQVPLPVKWKQTGTWNGFEIVVSEDAANVLLSITNTTLKTKIPKSSFTAMQVMVDPKTTKEYQDLLATLAQTISDRDHARVMYESEVREHENTRAKMLELIAVVKRIRAVHEADTAVLIWIPKSAFK